MLNNKTFVLIFCISALVLGGIFYLIYPTPIKYDSPKEEPLETATSTHE